MNPTHYESKSVTWANNLKVKWPILKRIEKVVNTDFIFSPNTKVQFVSPEECSCFR